MYGEHQEFNKTAVKQDDKQQYKAIIEASMFSTPEGCTSNIPMTTNPSVSIKNSSARKSLRKLSETLDVKHKTSVHSLGAAN